MKKRKPIRLIEVTTTGNKTRNFLKTLNVSFRENVTQSNGFWAVEFFVDYPTGKGSSKTLNAIFAFMNIN